MAEELEPSGYLLACKRVAVCMAKCRKLEKGGNLKPGWFDAREELMRTLRKACEEFEGMDFDIMDDAAQIVINAARKVKNDKL